MIYSNACAYAIRAMSRMAMIRPDGYLLLDDLCAETDLPRHFVAKIFQDLVRKGLLASAKGRGGGFALVRKPELITLYDIVAAVDGVNDLDNCVVGMAKCDDHQPCPQHDLWKGIRTQLRDYLQDTTLHVMASTLRKKLALTGDAAPEPTGKSKPLKLAE